MISHLHRHLAGALVLAAVLLGPDAGAADKLRIATYNLENYFIAPLGGRPMKSESGRAKIVESIKALNPDVLAVMEMGDPASFEQFRSSLKAAGLELPHWELVRGWDTNIHVAVLSKFPFTARRPHTNETFLLTGRRFSVSRGFAEVDVNVGGKYDLTLFAAHLKSRRTVAEADEGEMRLEEAKILRRLVDERLAANPQANLIILGDMNDVFDSPSVKALLGRGASALVDTRPAERNGDNTPNPNPRWFPRNITWTHFYGKEDTYSRIDYILLSKGMARELVNDETYLLAVPNWGVASDHRPLVATFNLENK